MLACLPTTGCDAPSMRVPSMRNSVNIFAWSVPAGVGGYVANLLPHIQRFNERREDFGFPLEAGQSDMYASGR